MKIALISLNFFLALVLVWAVAGTAESSADKSEYSVKKRVPAQKESTAKKSGNAEKRHEDDPSPIAVPENPEEDIEAIVGADLFNPERSPNASMRGRGGRVEMTLIGIFKTGDIEGAIIRQNTTQRNINPFLAQINNASRGNINRFSGGLQRFSANMNLAQRNQASRQYIRVGETLPNGYKLVSVSRTTAVLLRGGDRTELELQQPSSVRRTGRGGSRRLNTSQQLQQAQMITQMRMMQMMQQMQRNMNNNQNNNVPARRPGNTGRR